MMLGCEAVGLTVLVMEEARFSVGSMSGSSLGKSEARG